MQQKDVIYIDVEDDITAIISKVKDSKEKIVALVPPKRTGVLQSAVNLRLLSRAAGNANKRLVLITANTALSGLAASAKIPVAKNLQSKPEIADLKSFDDDEEDVIDGEQLPVGDHAKMADDDVEIVPPSTINGIDIDGESKSTKPTKAKKGIKVPDFGTFRKKLVLGILAGVLFVSFLVWAIWFAPAAKVIIGARTSSVEVTMPISIGEALQNDTEKATLSSIIQTDKANNSVEFEPTGEKEVGEKAKGQIVFSNCQDTNSLTINSGTYISSGSNNYVVQSTVVVPGGSGNFITGCTSAGVSAPVDVIATDIGDTFNTSAGSTFTVAGFSSKMTATSSAGISGGTSRTVKVVTTEDVEKARDDLAQKDEGDVKDKLREQFSSGVKIIPESFQATTSDPKVTPGIGEEVQGKAKLTTEVTYTMAGVAQAALDDYLKSKIDEQLDNDSERRIYESGAETAKFADFKQSEDGKTATLQLSATGQVGPKIDDNEIKEQVAGKRFGEIEGDLKAIDGVSDVDVQFSPFWVQTVPTDASKITIEFKLLGNG